MQNANTEQSETFSNTFHNKDNEALAVHRPNVKAKDMPSKDAKRPVQLSSVIGDPDPQSKNYGSHDRAWG